MRFTRFIILLVIFLWVNSLKAQSRRESMRQMFIDTTDNAVDASKWLGTVTGFVPLIIPITEPAVGYGAGVGLVFFHPNEFRRAAKEGRLNDPKFENISPTPPSLTGLVGGLTENGTWLAGIGHLAVWKQDRIRYKVGFGLGSVNLDYYGNGMIPGVERSFNTSFLGFMNEATFRISESDIWLGLGYSFAKSDIEFDKIFDWPEGGFNEKETRNGGLLPSITFDNRDNIFTANRGVRAYMQYGYYDTWLGGLEEYQLLYSYILGYHQWALGHVSGLRFEMKNTFGDPTFIYLPYLAMRGLPVMKYQDKNTMLLEFEQRIKVYNRWSLVAFGGLGKDFPEYSKFTEEDLVYTYGSGFRYYLAKKFGMHMGMDFAWGPEDFAFYITFGSAWMKL